MKTLIPSLLIVCNMLTGDCLFGQSDSILWYNKPAQYFEQSLVLGNGKMGASVFGGISSDKIFLNDATLWSGGPVNANMNPEAYKNLPAVREALNNENYRRADSLQHKMQGKYSESYEPVGTIFINFKNRDTATRYYRELNISDAVSKVEYEIDGVKYSREYFVSFPDKVMVIKLTSGKKGALNFGIKFSSLLKFKVGNSNGILSARGYAPKVAKPSYLGNITDPVVFDENNGTRFLTLIKIKNQDGIISSTDSTLSLTNGTETVIFVSIATSFNGYDKDPVAQGSDYDKIANEQLEKACSKTFRELEQAHILDYQKFFSRVTLNLGKSEAPSLPTDERLKRYTEGKEDKNLEILYFQYGRYLLISSSRTPQVPANLQGIWNPYIRPPWSCNYTSNINVEENYWLAENTNLSEMHLPLISFIKNISETGKITAKTFYRCNGWTECHNTDIWAMSNPVGDFGWGDPAWANWNLGGAWLVSHLWEHYLFTQDKNFLKNYAYELMKGSAQFCIDWMVKDKEGKLITSPSTSPENKYVSPTGYHGATFYGGTADLSIIRACLAQTVEASKVLGIDTAFRIKVENTIALLHPFKIGEKGNLLEWYYDWEDEDPHHRHQSHLFGLFPGHQITPYSTPDLANACRKTLEIKGDESTGWSKAWRINLWARLGDGNHAYKMYRELLTYIEPAGVKTNYSRGGGTYPNLFDAHPPFQIDGNFGGAAAVAEMLVQSDEREIRLLPALPDAWDSGNVKGICARGGFEISMYWNNHTLKKVTVFSRQGGKTILINGNIHKEIVLKAGEQKDIEWQWKISCWLSVVSF